MWVLVRLVHLHLKATRVFQGTRAWFMALAFFGLHVLPVLFRMALFIMQAVEEESTGIFVISKWATIALIYVHF